jgi:hypothetical protein
MLPSPVANIPSEYHTNRQRVDSRDSSVRVVPVRVVAAPAHRREVLFRSGLHRPIAKRELNSPNKVTRQQIVRLSRVSVPLSRRDMFLSADNVSHLKQKFPRSNYQTTPEWAEAVITEINSLLLPTVATEAGKKPDDLTQAVNKLTSEWQMANAVHHARDFHENELNLRERLDAMIARQVKHLIQTKAMKQILRQAAAVREDEQPKKIAARSASQ